MTQIDFGPEIFIGAVILLLALRWAHRCWGKAIMSALFAPLVLVPLGFVGYLAIGLLLRGFNGILNIVDLGFPTSALSSATGVITGLLLLGLLIHHCSEVRATPGPMKGPWLGTRYRVGEPKINQKSSLR